MQENTVWPFFIKITAIARSKGALPKRGSQLIFKLPAERVEAQFLLQAGGWPWSCWGEAALTSLWCTWQTLCRVQGLQPLPAPSLFPRPHTENPLQPSLSYMLGKGPTAHAGVYESRIWKLSVWRGSQTYFPFCFSAQIETILGMYKESIAGTEVNSWLK